jgi:hypothetical protein
MSHRNQNSNKRAAILAALASLALLGAVLIVGSHACRTVHAASSQPQTPPVPSPVLVELFTSEGCSSCPPADALLAQLDATQTLPGGRQVIVLSEHVTYWNHDGWHDPFSSQTFTDRQNDYRIRFGLSDAYTPQVVVDGAQELVGSDRVKLLRAIQSAGSQPKIPLTLENVQWSGGSVTAQVSAQSDARSATLIAALADDSDQSSVLHGENQGRNLRHVAVVRTLVESRKIKGPLNKLSIQIKLPAGIQPQPKMRLIVFLADSHTGHILGATMQTLQH